MPAVLPQAFVELSMTFRRSPLTYTVSRTALYSRSSKGLALHQRRLVDLELYGTNLVDYCSSREILLYIAKASNERVDRTSFR